MSRPHEGIGTIVSQLGVSCKVLSVVASILMHILSEQQDIVDLFFKWSIEVCALDIHMSEFKVIHGCDA